ncbi:MAG: TetR/AcrR family transcriptional regulator [Bacteroidales bacterium]|nr:TetR/AcrR family transcriptional regulator [Bacteroidales bacterium]
MRVMNKKPYNEITISDIIKAAGVSRPTFNRNYKSKDDMIIQFFEEYFNSVSIKEVQSKEADQHKTFELSISQKNFIRYAEFLRTIFKSEAKHLYLSLFSFSEKWETMALDFYTNGTTENEMRIVKYLVKYRYSGALHVIIDWVENDRPVSAENLAFLLSHFMNHDIALEKPFCLNISIPHIIFTITGDE